MQGLPPEGYDGRAGGYVMRITLEQKSERPAP
jgi:hypothetical protein